MVKQYNIRLQFYIPLHWYAVVGGKKSCPLTVRTHTSAQSQYRSGKIRARIYYLYFAVSWIFYAYVEPITEYMVYTSDHNHTHTCIYIAIGLQSSRTIEFHILVGFPSTVSNVQRYFPRSVTVTPNCII